MESDNLKNVSRNSVFLFTSRFFDMGAVLLTNVIITRSLGALSFGQYSFISAYVVSITVISYFGLDNLTMREIAKRGDRAQHYLGAVIVTRWIMSGLATFLILAGLPWIGLEREFFPALALLTASELIGAFVTIQIAVFRAKEQMKYEIYITVFWRLVSLILISLGAYLGFDVMGLCAAMLLANVARALLAAWISETRFFKPDFSEVNVLIKGIFKDAITLGAAILLTNWLFRSAQIAIKFMLDAQQVAYFQISHTIILQVSTVALSVMIALFPMISKKAQHDQENMRRMADIYSGVSKLLICLGLIFSTILILISEPLILLLFGAEYFNAVKVFRILLASLVPVFLYSLHVMLFIAYNKQHYIILSRGGSLILAYCLYVLLIPRTGVAGAAFAYVIVSAFIGLLEALLLKYRVVPTLKPPFAIYFLNLILTSSLSVTLIFNYSLPLRVALLLLILIIAILQLKNIYAIIRFRRQALIPTVEN